MFNKSFECPGCKKLININLEDYIIDQSSKERGMGTAVEHTIEVENTCDNCKYKYKIEGSICEYPVGVENSNELRIH